MTNEIKFELESEKLTSYLESWLEDFQLIAREMLDKVSKDHGTTLNVPDSEMAKIKRLSSSLEDLSRKKFVIENVPDFSSIATALKNVEDSIRGLSIPKSIKVDIPKFEIPKGVDQKIDLSPLQNQIESLSQVIQQGIRVNNLEEVPLVFPKAIDIKKDGLNIGIFDYVSVAYPAADTETYTFKVGGSSGTIVAKVTVVYVDSSKEAISSVTKI